MKILTAAEMKAVDRLTIERYGIPSLSLMENAGKSVAQLIQKQFSNLSQRRVIVLCGKGNNGGDGFVAARHLAEMGANPIVYLLAGLEEIQGDAAINCQRWQNASGQLYLARNSAEWQSAKSAIASIDLVVDALLGTGVRGAVEGMLREVIDGVNQASRAPASAVVSVDIPSGLVADTGEVGSVAVVADYTVTFNAPKIGLLIGAADHYVGRLSVENIGSPAELIEEVGKSRVRWSESREFAQFAQRRKPAANKGNYGHALIVAGSVGKSGAAVLASRAALRSGAGLVTVATPEPVLSTVAAHTPEIMTEPLPTTESGSISMGALDLGIFERIVKGKNVLGIGPGLTTNDATQQFVRAVVKNPSDVPIVLDADGLNAFAGRAADLSGAGAEIALTPHPGEMARLSGYSIKDVQTRRIENAQKAAADWQSYVILKGHQTIIAAPDGRTWINSTGNPGMATGGTGDVLTGMLTGLTAQFGVGSWAQLLSFGVYLHGLAGDLAAAELGEPPLIAGDLIEFIPQAYKHFYFEFGRG
jgi:hydroxyethylthiazole kinase-like uncharacterized protein yjeF